MTKVKARSNNIGKQRATTNVRICHQAEYDFFSIKHVYWAEEQFDEYIRSC
jgi:hypothetical protein